MVLKYIHYVTERYIRTVRIPGDLWFMVSPTTRMYANSMNINRTYHKYTLNIDSLPYSNTISFGLFSNSVRSKCAY